MTQAKARKAAKEEFQLKDVWPQLRSALGWLLKNQLEGATELMRMVICKRRKEKELEKSKVEDQMKSTLEQVKGRKDAEDKTVMIEVCCRKDSKLASHFKKHEER